MASIGISCTICHESYKSIDEIYSTNCGHVFHPHCIRQWQQQSSQCPTCRSYSSSSQGHKIYLDFDDGSTVNEKRIDELKKKLEESVLNASILQKDLDDSIRNFMIITEQLSECEEKIMQLNEKNEYLNIQNDSRKKDLDSKTMEILRLQEALNASPTSSGGEGSNVVLQQDIKILKEKLQQMELTLKKEITNSMELTVDKMKLQSMLEQATKSLKANKEKTENTSLRPVTTETNEKASGSSVRQDAKNSNFFEAVMIDNVFNTFTETKSLTDYAMKLIQLMNISLKVEDIQDVAIMERKNAEILTIMIKFFTSRAKLMFLANRDSLKMHEETKKLIVREVVKCQPNPIFAQAKSLRSFGYKAVYCKKGNVFVKKTEKSFPIRIRNMQDIEDLKRKAHECEEPKQRNAQKSEETKVRNDQKSEETKVRNDQRNTNLTLSESLLSLLLD